MVLFLAFSKIIFTFIDTCIHTFIDIKTTSQDVRLETLRNYNDEIYYVDISANYDESILR